MCCNDEFSLMMSWVGYLLKDSEIFILFAENRPNPSQNFCYSHSFNSTVSGSSESVSKQPTQTWLIIVAHSYHIGHDVYI